MPRLQQAKKALRQSETRKQLNDSRKRAVKETVKAAKVAVVKGTLTTRSAEMVNAQSALDKAAKRGVIKKGAASRMKSRLAQAGKKTQG
jgi:small subunit ribosomal protein S20